MKENVGSGQNIDQVGVIGNSKMHAVRLGEYLNGMSHLISLHQIRGRSCHSS